WKSAVGFWRSGGDRLSWYLGGLLLLISLLNLATAYGMNVWNRGMFDALEKRDSQTVLLLSFAYLNPEYRIADDVRIATESPVEFATGMTAALLSATTFIAVLWTIGGSLTFELR